MKAVLISINPNPCVLIEDRKKKVEVRKTRPNIQPPFKVLIYETLGERIKLSALVKGTINRGVGKVIGEFICNKIEEYHKFILEQKNRYEKQTVEDILNRSCLTFDELSKYLTERDKKPFYIWNISNLVIYDEPRDLSEFHYPPEKYCEKELCGNCPKYEVPSYEYGEVDFDCEWKRPIERPPQSWCYVEAQK